MGINKQNNNTKAKCRGQFCLSVLLPEAMAAAQCAASRGIWGTQLWRAGHRCQQQLDGGRGRLGSLNDNRDGKHMLEVLLMHYTTKSIIILAKYRLMPFIFNLKYDSCSNLNWNKFCIERYVYITRVKIFFILKYIKYIYSK